MPILGFIMKDKNGLELIGDNTSNMVPESDQITVKKDEIIRGTFIFTMPLLRKGEYSITVSLASGNNEEHDILHWINDALIMETRSSILKSGLVGVAMHSVKLELMKDK